MCKQRLKHPQQECGFTLLDSLLQLIVLVLFAQFFLLFYSWYSQKDNGMFNNNELQWEIFAFQLQKELTHTKQFTRNTIQNISYSSDRGTLSVAIGPGELKREKGYQPLLFGITTVKFEYSDYILDATINFENGKGRSRKFIVPNNTR
ncbi:competence type IV pilus minor pilin ComGF [Rummeliibacillus suwonensis]|uniref:competence type IV pilus minor pilin ComGF n=1 Tax=Rummeliibacillus suwonensis TaxID=1306154 RepID=UPI0028984B85|nr:competence type IV pilus minor pilin ComGF [Rummeliibacillus suwonensis]